MSQPCVPSSAEPLDPAALVTACIEGGHEGILLDESALPPAFFDLSTGWAGELLHRLSVYRLRLAGVVPDPGAHSPAFQDFVREANRGGRVRFFTTRAEAEAWLDRG